MLDKEYKAKIISNEIKELFSEIDQFLMKKDDLMQSIKNVYLAGSNFN